MASTIVDIDSLLQRYLTLLDEYTRLRAALNTVQSGIYHDLARANFSAERGIRYGQDYYDDRMQAIRRVAVAAPSGVPIFSIISKTSPDTAGDAAPSPSPEPTTTTNGPEEEKEEPPKYQQKPPPDPLRWFGILTPMPLRHAQTQAARAVEELLPQLATVSAAMAAVELAVRRARKKRAKAEAAAEKAQQQIPPAETTKSSQGVVSA